MNVKKGFNVKLITATLVIFLGLGTGMALGHDTAKGAGPYSSKDKIYLNKIVPIITELSEVGQAVSASAVGLQSGPTDECANENRFYQGLVGGLRNDLNRIVPPVRMKALHVKALDGFTDYMTGLNLYISACVDKDTQMRTKLFDQGTQYITNADITMQQVNDMIANPSHVPEKPSAADQIKEWCGNLWATNYEMQEHCVREQTESRTELGGLIDRNPRGTQGFDVILDCTATWTDQSGAYNYKMIVFCIKNKI